MSRKERNLLGYVTLCADAIGLDKIKHEQMKEKNINYKSLPALKICRMGIKKGFTGRGIGKKMIAFAVKQALRTNEMSACRFITLDAKNDEQIPESKKPMRFYKKMGFLELKTRKKRNTVYMYRDLIDIIKSEAKL